MPTTTTDTTSTTTDLRPRPGLLDIALTLLACAAGLYLAYMNYSEGPTNSVADGGPITISAWAVPTFLIVTLPMLWRSSAPTVALGGMIAGLLVHFAAFGEMIHCGIAYPVIAILAYAAGNRRSGQDRLIAGGLAIVAVVTTGVTDFLGPETMVLGLPLAVIGFALGAAVAGRTRLAPIREQGARA